MKCIDTKPCDRLCITFCNKEEQAKCVTCDKCGKEITTGLMAAFCEYKKECEFYVEGIESFMESVST